MNTIERVLFAVVIAGGCGEVNDEPLDNADSGDTASASAADPDGTSNGQSTSADAAGSDSEGGASTASSNDATSGPGTDDTAADDSTGEPATTGEPEQPGPDFREVGPHATTAVGGSASVGGCTMPYDIIEPSDVADAPTVVLAHGFQGNRASMRGWADHFASWGLRVVTPNLCHATIADTDHAQNGADLVALAGQLAIANPTYAGYSAGGLAAVVAAASDPGTVALLGLDMVDSGGIGAGAAAMVDVPAHDIVAEPAMCNSTANGVPVFNAMTDSTTVRLFEADHCDFQNPPDGFCSFCASPNAEHTPESIAADITGLATAALLWRTGVDETGSQWWTPGSGYYDAMILAGTLAQL